MEKTFGSARLNNDAQSRSLIAYLSGHENDLGIADGTVYYDFPLFRDANDQLHRADVLLASRRHGIILFSAIKPQPTVDEVVRADEDLSQLQSIIYGKCLQSKRLRRSQRELLFSVTGFLLLTSDGVQTTELENTIVRALGTIPERLATLKLGSELSEEAWQETRAILEGTKAIIRPKQRQVPPERQHMPNSKVVLLAELENEIANFDANQRRAAISIVDGPQRIRGLAGSGKTVVLAMKAAHIHLTNPDADVLVTFYTKSLYEFIRRLITRFYRQFNDRDPDWNRVHVRHAWGGRSTAGVYYDACLHNGQSPLQLRNVVSKGDPFEYVCDELLKVSAITPTYDYVLMDEAQDFPSSFFRLCFALVRGGRIDRNVIWAYDELQNIINVRVASPRELFGTAKSGEPVIDLERAAHASQQGVSHDIVLYKCYRNAREVLICAHALGFGIYSDTMVQTLENKEHWEDLGYIVERGTFRVGSRIVVSRPESNSPLTISKRQQPHEIISTFVAASVQEEIGWIVRQIRNLVGEGLRAEDIMVVSLDDRNARDYFKGISDGLDTLDIRVNNVLADPYSSPRFSIPDHVTLSTVYRAKGNEAAVVFALGIDAIYPNRKQQQARNKLFTAFTRAKGWLRVSGVGEGAARFMAEIAEAISKMPRLEFLQPDPAQIIDVAARLKRSSEQASTAPGASRQAVRGTRH